MGKIRVFLVDDHPIVLEGLRNLLHAQPDMQVVGEASEGRAAVEQMEALHPDIVVMDLSLPLLDGIAATGHIMRQWPRTKIIVLTVHEDHAYLRQALATGARGYVVKRSAAQDLVRAIRVVADGDVYLDPIVTGRIVQGYIRKVRVQSPSESAILSEREQEVLCLVSQGLSSREVAAQLGLSVKTVETYRFRAMEKLGLDSRADIVRYALQQGWLREDPEG